MENASITSNEYNKSALFRIENASTPFKFYRTATVITSKSHHPSITEFNDSFYVLIPTDNSYAIYNLQSLTLHFLGPYFQSISSILHSGRFVYVASESVIFKVDRGDIVEKVEFPGVEILEMVSFGTHFLINARNTLVICERQEVELKKTDIVDYEEDNKNEAIDLKEVRRITFTKQIKTIFHPHSYVNKVLMTFDDGTAILYNINSNKTIYEYSFGLVSLVAQTAVVDVVGLALEDGTIKLYNLKKDKILFEITHFKGQLIRNLHFKDKIAAITTDDLMLYDLEIKKVIYKKTGVSSGLVLNEKMAFMTTENTIQILSIDDQTVLKSRSILNTGINEIKAISSTELLLISKEKLFKFDVYRDESGCFLKNNHHIEQLSSENSGANILMYGEKRLSFLDKNRKYYDFINMNCRFMKVFGDFCILGSPTKIVIMNIKSKRVVLTMPIEKKDKAIDACIENKYFTVLFSDRICRFNFLLEIIYKVSLKKEISTGKIEKNNKMYFVTDHSDPKYPKLTVISEESKFSDISSDDTQASQVLNEKHVEVSQLKREFNISKFIIDPSGRVIVGIIENEVLIFDISTGSLLDTISSNKNLVDVAILDNMKFIAVLDSNSQLHLLSNLSHFNLIKNSSIFEASYYGLDVSLTKIESTFYKDLMLYKSFDSKADTDLVLKGLSKEEVEELLVIIRKNIKKDVFNIQKVLRKLLLYKASFIEPESIAEIKEEVEKKTKEMEESLLKSMGYLRMQKDGLLE
ncbi:WD repeat-containing protein 36 [Glugoides intestinalis]